MIAGSAEAAASVSLSGENAVRCFKQPWLFLAVLMGCLGVADWTRASHGVNDDGKCFSSGASERASQKIKDIYRDYQKDLLIDTVPEIPEALKARYDKQGRKEFFIEWSRQRAGDVKVKGIYIFVCRQPGHLQIEVDRATRERAFPLAERDRLVQKLLPLLKDKKFDAALQDAVDFVSTTLQQNVGKTRAPSAGTAVPGVPHPPARPAPAPSLPARQLPSAGIPIMGWVCFGLICLAVVWVISAVVRAFSGRGGGYAPGPATGGGFGGGGYGGGYGGGGGGFMTSLLGGIFGAAAGNWMYDRFLRGGNSSWGQEPLSRHESGDQAYARPEESGAGDFSGDSGGGADFDYTSADQDSGGAGDFGGDSGGGFDGGDFGGGGDLGGGDFGGGGFGGDSGGGDSW